MGDRRGRSNSRGRFHSRGRYPRSSSRRGRGQRPYNNRRGYGRVDYPSSRRSRGSRGRSQSRGNGRSGSYRFRQADGRSRQDFPAQKQKTNYTHSGPDFEQLMREMSSAITSLNKRVDQLFSGEGRAAPTPERDSKSHRRPWRGLEFKKSTRHGEEREEDDGESRSSNRDFATIAKSLFKLVQARHYLENWKTVPHSVGERIDDLLLNIKPPLADDAFQKDMETLGMEIGHRLCEINQSHLERTITSLAATVGPMHTLDLDRAKTIADKYAQQRLGKRLPADRRREFLEEAAMLVGVARPSTPPEEPWTTVVARKDKHKKRKASSVTSSAGGRQMDAMDDVEPFDTPARPPHQISTETLPPSTKKTRASPGAKTTLKTGVIVYSCNPEEWEIEPTGKRPWLMLADSNMREATKIPADVEIHCLPGAKLIHGATALQRMRANKKYSILVQLGIHNRQDTPETAEREGRAIVTALESHPCVEDMKYLLVPTPAGLPSSEKRMIRELNTALMEAVGAENCFQPLDTAAVQVRSTDATGIHHLPDTINLVLDSTASFFADRGFRPTTA